MSLNKDSTFLKWNSTVTSLKMMNLEYDKQNKMAGRLLKNNYGETITQNKSHSIHTLHLLKLFIFTALGFYFGYLGVVCLCIRLCSWSTE